MEALFSRFSVDRPIEDAWRVLTDLERIARCMPGARLKEIEGDIHRGSIKVKVGAVSTEFQGEAEFVERDAIAYRAVLKAAGQARGGLGQAEAIITATLSQAVGATQTVCTVETELHITGKVAQFGRGIMGDVSKKLMDQFAANLNRMLDEQGGTPAGEPAPTAAKSSSTAPSGGDGNGDGVTTAEPAPRVRKINGPAAEPVDLAGVAGPAVIKRVLPIVLALLVVVLILRRRK